MSERDLFANFDRMRRELDELFGDALERSGLSRRQTGRWPHVDVAYATDPPRAIVTAELAGMDVDDIALQIEGRRLSELQKGQREYVLRQQLKAIQEELGEGDEAVAEARELREQLEALALPEEVSKQVDRELGRLERLQPAMAEYGVVRNYLEWIASLPWDTSTEDNLDLTHAREVLDADHYDIEQVKDLNHGVPGGSLADDRLAATPGGLDPHLRRPSRGRQDLAGRSVARALGRRFERISVGGVRDEAEIRGHRHLHRRHAGGDRAKRSHPRTHRLHRHGPAGDHRRPHP